MLDGSPRQFLVGLRRAGVRHCSYTRILPGAGFQRLFLRGLSREDSGSFIGVTTGIRSSAGLVDTIYEHTKGNPFFITEVVRLLSDRGELRQEEAGT